jgi:hypothetical protein
MIRIKYISQSVEPPRYVGKHKLTIQGSLQKVNVMSYAMEELITATTRIKDGHSHP